MFEATRRGRLSLGGALSFHEGPWDGQLGRPLLPPREAGREAWLPALALLSLEQLWAGLSTKAKGQLLGENVPGGATYLRVVPTNVCEKLVNEAPHQWPGRINSRNELRYDLVFKRARDAAIRSGNDPSYPSGQGRIDADGYGNGLFL